MRSRKDEGKAAWVFRKKERKKEKNSLITDFPQGHYMPEEDVSGRASFDLSSIWSLQRKEGDCYLYFLVQNIGTASSAKISSVSWSEGLT